MNYSLEEKEMEIVSKLDRLTQSINLEKRDSIEVALKEAKLEVSKWQEVGDIVCVFSDLLDSTGISLDKQEATVAEILENLIVPLQDIHRSFGCEFIDVKGDGGIFLYSGKNAEVRAFLATVTTNSFFAKNTSALEEKYRIKFKVYSGISKGNILLKRVGARKDNFPVWAGDTVNISALITKELKNKSKKEDFYIGVTADVYNNLNTEELSNYLIMSCGCNSNKKEELWNPHKFEGRRGKGYYYMHMNWCAIHGQAYLNKVLELINKDG